MNESDAFANPRVVRDRATLPSAPNRIGDPFGILLTWTIPGNYSDRVRCCNTML